MTATGRLHRRSLSAVVSIAVVLTLGGSTAAFAHSRPTVTASTARTQTPRAAPADDTAPALGTAPAADQTGIPSATARATPSAARGSGAGPYRVVGLGDSVPAAGACGCPSYVTLVGQQAAGTAGRGLQVDNLARGGLTTAGLLAQVQDAATRSRIAAADLVIVTIGANDFDEDVVADPSCAGPALDCYRASLSLQAGRLSRLLSGIAGVQGGRGEVLVTGYWNVFLDGQVGRSQGDAYVRNSDSLTLAENAVIARASRSNGVRYVDLYAPFKGDGSRDDTALLAADGDHPSAAGHRVIAGTLVTAL